MCGQQRAFQRGEDTDGLFPSRGVPAWIWVGEGVVADSVAVRSEFVVDLLTTATRRLRGAGISSFPFEDAFGWGTGRVNVLRLGVDGEGAMGRASGFLTAVCGCLGFRRIDGGAIPEDVGARRLVVPWVLLRKRKPIIVGVGT